MQGVDRSDHSRDGEADPGQVIAQERRQQPTLGFRAHLQWQRGQRKRQALTVDPLPTEHDQQAEGDEVGRKDEQAPVEQRADPFTPGDGLPFGPTLEQFLHRVPIAEHECRFQVGQDEGRPVVLRCRVVQKPGQQRDQIHRQPPGRDGSADDHHDVDRRQFTGSQTGTGDATGKGIDQKGEQEEQEEGGAGGVIGRHGRALHHQHAVRLAGGDGETADHPKRNSSERNTSAGASRVSILVHGRVTFPNSK